MIGMARTEMLILWGQDNSWSKLFLVFFFFYEVLVLSPDDGQNVDIDFFSSTVLVQRIEINHIA
jgi:hypothetical protein